MWSFNGSDIFLCSLLYCCNGDVHFLQKFMLTSAGKHKVNPPSLLNVCSLCADNRKQGWRNNWVGPYAEYRHGKASWQSFHRQWGLPLCLFVTDQFIAFSRGQKHIGLWARTWLAQKALIPMLLCYSLHYSNNTYTSVCAIATRPRPSTILLNWA